MATKDPLDKPDASAATQARDEKHRVEGFHALLADHKHSSSYYEEMDGDWRQWPELSAEGKLSYLAGDAAYYDVPFHQPRRSRTRCPERSAARGPGRRRPAAAPYSRARAARAG